jgi:hypothetical protein
MTKLMIAIAVLALGVLAGCDSNSSGGGGAAGMAKTDEIGKAAVEFARCMRDHGYPVSDPTFDQDGLPQFGGAQTDIVKNEEYDNIRRTCLAPLTAAYQAAGVPNKKEINPDELLGFARCMREHGIDIPDPTAEDPLSIPKNAFTSPAWEPAKQACGSLLPPSWRAALDGPGKDAKQPGGGGK